MFSELVNKTILITGATGLIGQELTKEVLSLGMNVIAIVRDETKAKLLFGTKNIEFITCDICSLPLKKLNVDYIVHCAAKTSSKEFIQDPVGVSFFAIESSRRILELARLCSPKSVIFLSSMEVYGTPQSDSAITELSPSNLNTMSARSAYPESKRMCECLFASYFSQFGIPSRIIRLTQTFGPGVKYNDGRVFAEFARCAIEGRNIVLHTKGQTKRNYLYTKDAVSAILYVMTKGQNGEAYNASNEETYCSIYEMAQMVANKIADNKISVDIDLNEDVSCRGYAPTLHMNLHSAKLRSLGWSPKVNLENMFIEMINYMRNNS